MAASAQPADQPRASDRDTAWVLLASFLTFLFALVAIETVIAIFERDWSNVLGAPITMLFVAWAAVGAWRRTRWGARRQDARRPRRLDVRGFMLFLPNGYEAYLRRDGADIAVAFRSIAVVVTMLLVTFGTTLASMAAGLPNGPVLLWLPFLVVLATADFTTGRFVTARLIVCSSDTALASSYVSAVCLRIAFAVSLALFAFTFAVIAAPVWIYIPGAGFSLLWLWAGVVPTRRTLARDQRRLSDGGCERALTEVLRPAPRAGSESP